MREGSASLPASDVSHDSCCLLREFQVSTKVSDLEFRQEMGDFVTRGRVSVATSSLVKNQSQLWATGETAN